MLSLTVLMTWFCGFAFVFLLVFCCLFGRSPRKSKQKQSLEGTKKNSGHTCLGVWVCEDHAVGEVPHPKILSKWYQPPSIDDTIDVYVKIQHILQKELSREKLFLQTSGNCDVKASEVECHKSAENKKQDSNGAAVDSASASSRSNKDTHHPPFGVNDSLEVNASLQLSPTIASSLPHFREISNSEAIALIPRKSSLHLDHTRPKRPSELFLIENQFSLSAAEKLNIETTFTNNVDDERQVSTLPLSRNRPAESRIAENRSYCFKENCPWGGVEFSQCTFSDYRAPNRVHSLGCLPVNKRAIHFDEEPEGCLQLNSCISPDGVRYYSNFVSPAKNKHQFFNV